MKLQSMLVQSKNGNASLGLIELVAYLLQSAGINKGCDYEWA